MSRIIFSLWVCLLIVVNAFAINNGDTVYVNYDLQGGINNPNNANFYVFDRSNKIKYPLLPPTKEGFEFLGWYNTRQTLNFIDNSKRDYLFSYESPTQGNQLRVHARWGIISKKPQVDESGCMLVHDAAELYGAVKFADSTSRRTCIFIESDIVVNKNLLSSNGDANKGDFYWWQPFRSFSGVIEGNGHTISGLYGNVGLIQEVSYGNTVIQNLGIVDSYFSGENAGSFISNVFYGNLELKNVFSSATVIGTKGYVGGLIGFVDVFGDPCVDITFVAARNPAAYTIRNGQRFVTIENSYSVGYLSGEEGGGLVGILDAITIKNSFYAGKIDVTKKFSGIGLKQKKTCLVLSDEDLTFENVFYPEKFLNSGFEATPASDTEFANGSVYEKLKKGTEYPIWQQKSGDSYPTLNGVYYDILYYLNKGVNNASNPTYFMPKQEVVLKPASKEGDVFEGWFTDSIFTNPVEKISATAEGNQRVFAKWKNWYSITYVNDGDYGIGGSSNPKYRDADSATFVLEEPIGNGRTFEGWFTDSTFTKRVTELPQGNTEDIVLIGKWSGREITLIYNLHGGTMGDEKNPEKVVNGENILLKNPTREGYIFRGWIDPAKSGIYLNTHYEAYSAKYDTISLHAKWVYEPEKPAVDSNGCYLVTNVHELYYFNDFANDYLNENPPVDACIQIMNDIVVHEKLEGLRPQVFSNYHGYVSWNPLNGYNNPFVGIIYGNGHTISGLFMDSKLPQPDVFNGIIQNKAFDGKYPEVQNLYISNYYYDCEVHPAKLLINAKGDGNGGRTYIRKDFAPTPLKATRDRRFDVKGRSSKIRPNYGVYF